MSHCPKPTWKCPATGDILPGLGSPTEATHRLRREQHAKFRQWQDSIVMNMIFGDNYVASAPLPPGYEDYAKWWFDNELKAFK